MSNRTLSIDDRVYDYILSVSVDEMDLLGDLREETKSIDFPEMQISPEQGQFMTFLVRLIKASRALEIGTYTGYSSICIARGLTDKGRLLCCDVHEGWTDIAKKYWQRGGYEDCIELRLQEAAKTLTQLIKDGQGKTFDFVFIDADKQNYLVYYEACLQLVRTDGLICVDNTLWSGAVADPANMEPATRAIRNFNEFVRDDKRVDLTLLPIGDGLTLLRVF